MVPKISSSRIAFPSASEGTSPNKKAVRSRLAFAEGFLRCVGSDPESNMDDEEGLLKGFWEDEEMSGSSIHEKEDCASVERVGIGGCGRWSVWTVLEGSTPRGSVSIFSVVSGLAFIIASCC
ncbi:hypothetical protein RRF57_007704 [Xylaria bambusicola]|uniref:Uncharacterized protein n=1 Tax=Xylaria bambusicola TaxID=326684 RepID=A0AAN7UGL9_9PEZI